MPANAGTLTAAQKRLRKAQEAYRHHVGGIGPGPCQAVVQARLLDTGEIVYEYAETGERWSGDSRPIAGHKHSRACLTVIVDGWHGDAGDPGFAQTMTDAVEHEVARVRSERQGVLPGAERRMLADLQRICSFYGLPFSNDAAALLEGQALPPLRLLPPPKPVAPVLDPVPLPAPSRPASETTLTMERTERPRPCCSACSCPVEAHSAATAHYLCTECFAGDVWAHLDRFSRLAGPNGSRVCESFKAAAPARLDTCSKCTCLGLTVSPSRGEQRNG